MELGWVAAAGVERVKVRFVTAAEIKGGAFSVESPDFGPLLARIRDRVSNLAWLYGGERRAVGDRALEYRALSLAAGRVFTVRSDLREVREQRTSQRSGQTHWLGGLMGDVEYGGELAAFVPWLEAARWTGVGRQTVWGKGEMETLVL